MTVDVILPVRQHYSALSFSKNADDADLKALLSSFSYFKIHLTSHVSQQVRNGGKNVSAFARELGGRVGVIPTQKSHCLLQENSCLLTVQTVYRDKPLGQHG